MASATYTITEKQDLASTRRGYEFIGNLMAAKADAVKNRMYKGTVLTIERGEVLVAYHNGMWHDC